MNLIKRATQLSESLMGSGKARIEELRDGRRRNELLQELGTLTYRKHCGDPIDAAAIDSLVAALDRLAPGQSDTATTDEPDVGVNAGADA